MKPNELDTYEIKRYQPEDKSGWDGFVAKAKNATFLFQRDFMDYHSHRFEDYSLVVYNNAKIVAVLPANLKDGVLYSHQGLSYGGLVIGKKATLQEVLEIFQSLLHFLDTEGIAILNLKLLPKIYNLLPSDEMDYLLFLIKANLTRRDLSSCIFNENPLKIESSIRLKGIIRGEKKGLQVREEQNLDSFWNDILEPNLQQVYDQKPVHSLEEITSLKSFFPKNIRQFSVFKSNEIVGGATLFETTQVVHVQYISANAVGRKDGGLDFLFSHLFQHFAHKKFFDFGVSNVAQGMKVNQGLLFWKESFGGRAIVHDFYEVKTDSHHLLNDIFV